MLRVALIIERLLPQEALSVTLGESSHLLNGAPLLVTKRPLPCEGEESQLLVLNREQKPAGDCSSSSGHSVSSNRKPSLTFIVTAPKGPALTSSKVTANGGHVRSFLF